MTTRNILIQYFSIFYNTIPERKSYESITRAIRARDNLVPEQKFNSVLSGIQREREIVRDHNAHLVETELPSLSETAPSLETDYFADALFARLRNELHHCLTDSVIPELYQQHWETAKPELEAEIAELREMYEECVALPCGTREEREALKKVKLIQSRSGRRIWGAPNNYEARLDDPEDFRNWKEGIEKEVLVNITRLEELLTTLTSNCPREEVGEEM